MRINRSLPPFCSQTRGEKGLCRTSIGLNSVYPKPLIAAKLATDPIAEPQSKRERAPVPILYAKVKEAKTRI